MIKYLGSKRTLVPVIGALAAALPARTAVDLFAGTTRVGQELRRRGLRVVSNDVTAFSEAFGQAYIAAGAGVDRHRLRRLLAGLEALPPLDGYVTETFCRAARYFQPQNGMRIDAARAGIDRLEALLKAVPVAMADAQALHRLADQEAALAKALPPTPP